MDRARTEERSLLRAWMMRKTVHLIPSEDAGWIVPLFAPMIVRWARKRLGDFGLDMNGQERAMAVLERAIDRDGPLTRSELTEHLEQAGFDTAPEFKVHLWLLATLDRELCLGPDRGGQTCLVPTREWLGKPEGRPRDESLAELARRFLRAYGPATERDLARWSGLPLRDTSVGLERIANELEQVRFEDETLLEITSARGRLPSSPVVRLLGAYDNYNMGYESRDFYLPPAHLKQVLPGGGIVRPTITLDGKVVGTWSSKRRGRKLAVGLEPFAALDDATKAAIAGEIEDIGRFEGFAARLA